MDDGGNKGELLNQLPHVADFPSAGGGHVSRNGPKGGAETSCMQHISSPPSSVPTFHLFKYEGTRAAGFQIRWELTHQHVVTRVVSWSVTARLGGSASLKPLCGVRLARITTHHNMRQNRWNFMSAVAYIAMAES